MIANTLRALVMKYDPTEVPDNVVKVQVARCNVAANDVPVDVYGVPSVKLFPAGKKHLPVEFFGSLRHLQDYEEFIFGETDDGIEERASRRNTGLSEKESAVSTESFDLSEG